MQTNTPAQHYWYTSSARVLSVNPGMAGYSVIMTAQHLTGAPMIKDSTFHTAWLKLKSS